MNRCFYPELLNIQHPQNPPRQQHLKALLWGCALQKLDVRCWWFTEHRHKWLTEKEKQVVALAGGKWLVTKTSCDNVIRQSTKIHNPSSLSLKHTDSNIQCIWRYHLKLASQAKNVPYTLLSMEETQIIQSWNWQQWQQDRCFLNVHSLWENVTCCRKQRHSSTS